MNSTLMQLKRHSTIVADTGDISAIASFQPQDATTNPSLILKAAQLPDYAPLIDEVLQQVRSMPLERQQQVEEACDRLAVNIGQQILDIVPGRISTEVNARLSYDTQASVAKARKLVGLYGQAGISKDRILIKLASTWEGIRAAEILEKEGVNCNLTLLFSFAQARACAEAGVYLISPFVGRIMDWYQAKENKVFSSDDDPGVKSVTRIYNYYKSHGYQTVVMGASFRNTGEITELAGCDRLTISPELLTQLSHSTRPVPRMLFVPESLTPRPMPMTHSEFLWEHHQDAMAVEKLAEGIRNFAIDQAKLEQMIDSLL